MIVGLRFPVSWARLGFPSQPLMGGVVLAEGAPAWSWEGTPPDLPIAGFDASPGTPVPGWLVDHVVVVVGRLAAAVASLEQAGAMLRRPGEARGRPAAFLRAGCVIEVVEIGGVTPRLWGVALETAAPLEEVAARWRGVGLQVGQPHPAIQPGRRIFSVRDVGLAVMSARLDSDPADRPEGGAL